VHARRPRVSRKQACPRRAGRMFLTCVKGFRVCPRLALMVMGWSGCINLAARLRCFRVDPRAAVDGSCLGLWLVASYPSCVRLFLVSRSASTREALDSSLVGLNVGNRLARGRVVLAVRNPVAQLPQLGHRPWKGSVDYFTLLKFAQMHVRLRRRKSSVPSESADEITDCSIELFPCRNDDVGRVSFCFPGHSGERVWRHLLLTHRRF
jgi:hypothetical protein